MTSADLAGARDSRTVRVWDPVVRLFHWTVVAGCSINLLLDDGRLVHRWVGYAVAVTLLVRLVWGFVGSRHARFGDFVPDRTTLRGYVADTLRGRERRYLGHNPLGALMIMTLMAVVAVVSLTGWLLTLDAYWGSEMLEEVHEAFANAIVPLVAVHVAGVLYGSLRHGENLVRAMVTGRKRR